MKTHRFPFQYKLPPELPASFESEFGSIRYTVKVIIDMPRQMNIEMEETIKVYKMIDANDPQLQVIDARETTLK